MSDLPLTLHGEPVMLLGDGALLRLHDRTLYLADLHWGKAAAFRAARIPVPFGTTDDTVTRLDRLIGRVMPSRMVVLGDLWHARDGRHSRTIAALRQWRQRHRQLPMLLVRGNHDRAAGDPPEDFLIDCTDAPVRDGAFVLRHHPMDDHQARDTSFTGFWLAGHVHPAVELVGFPRERLRLPCFHLTPNGLILPAFGAFTGKAVVTSRPGDRVFVLAEGDVVEVSRI